MNKKDMLIYGITGTGKSQTAWNRIDKDETTLMIVPTNLNKNKIEEKIKRFKYDKIDVITIDDFMNSQINDFEIKTNKNITNELIFGKIMDEAALFVMEYKLSDKIRTIIDKYVTYLENNVNFFDMEYNPNFKIEKLDLIDYYFNKLLDLPFKKRIEKLKEYIIEQLNLRIPNNEFIKKYSQLCNEKYNVDTKKLFIDLFNTKKSLLLEFANNETEFNILNNNMLDVISGKLSYEDSLIYIYFKFKIEGYCINEKYSHVIIEEFQDYQYIHLKILRETFKNACITLVVNNQCKLYKAKTRIFQNNIFDIINDIFIDTVKRPIFYNIRSSKDICLYINKHKGQKIKYLNQNISNRIRVIKEIDIKSRLRKIIACIDIEKYRRIGIIVYSLNELVDNMNPRLLKDNKINIIDDDKKSTLDGYINILPCYATYGLEFDYLVIFNKESYSENMRIFKMLLCKTVDKVDVYE